MNRLSQPIVDAPISLSTITTTCPSPQLSVTKDHEDLRVSVPAVTISDLDGRDSLGRNTPEIKPKTLKSREYIQFVALCWYVYLQGWNDGTTGPLLPRIQQVYGVDYLVVSLIFIFACVGFLTGAFSNVVLSEKLGFGKLMVIGSLFQVVAYSIDSAAPPFPVLLLAYCINGIGMGWQNAQSVSYVACIKENAETKMGIFMAAYGAGALSSPLVATQFAQLPHWSFHYLTSLGVALINTVIHIVVFRFRRQEECLAEIGLFSDPRQTNERSNFHQLFALKGLHALATFCLLYVGAEVTLGGWIVTYIAKVRGAGPSAGYISTGFWAGLMLGRVLLLWVNQKIGERLALFIYALCAIGLEFLVWFVPSLVGDAIAIAIIGLLLGPMWPIAMNHCGRVFPRWILTGAIGWVAGLGQAGSALLPFVAGSIASKAGIATLQPVLIGMLVSMTAMWAMVPKSARIRD